jgi:isopropylmalate/homocitrate/citramalate synthase
MGYGVSYPGVALPRSVPGIVYGLHHYADVSSDMLEWHGHNDFYHGVTNAVNAWLYGASGVNCSLLGIGERTGNIPTEAMVMEYAAIRGGLDGMDTTVITEIAEYFEKELNYSIPPMTPFVGSAFNLTRAGIHADGIMKDTEIYNIFNTEKILNRPAEVAISNTSGAAGIAYWINKHFDLPSGVQIDKHSPLVVKVKEEIDRLYADGRTTLMGNDEIMQIVKLYSPLLKEEAK